jgi:WD40 repeat protein
MDVSPDGKRAAVAGNLSETPVVWDLTKNRKAATLTGLAKRVSCLDYSPEGDFITAATFGGEVVSGPPKI